MTEDQSFGARIRALRKQRNLDQRTLADQVDRRLRAEDRPGFDVTYLSKIENGRLPPPSTRAIELLAEALGEDPFDLIALAGKVPPAVGRQIQESPGARVFHRSALEMNLSEEEWRQLIDDMRRRRGEA